MKNTQNPIGQVVQVTGELQGKPVTINFPAQTNEAMLLLVRRQLANSYLNANGEETASAISGGRV